VNVQFRPTLWPTLITVPALALLVYLGWWQVERLQWKNDLIAELQVRAAATAIPMPVDRRVAADDLVFRTVTVTGRYVHEAEMRLLNQVRDGLPGINVFTPLVRSDGAGILLVNRGWVPFDWQGSTPEHSEGGVEVEVTGVVRIPDSPSWLTPDNEPDKNNWYYADLTEMARASGMLTVTDYYIYATDERLTSGEPRPLLAPDPNEWHATLRNNHLTYAITWFSLAGALFVIYVIYHTRRRNRDDA
jgi:surfeit locus 1 family protein